MEFENFDDDDYCDIIIKVDKDMHNKFSDVLAVRGFKYMRDTIGIKGKNSVDKWKYMYVYDRKQSILTIKKTLIAKKEIKILLDYLFGLRGGYRERGMTELAAFLICERPGQWPAKFKDHKHRDIVDRTLFFSICMLILIEEDYSGNICRGECLLGGHRHNIIYDFMISETKTYADDIVTHYGKGDGPFIRLIHDIIDRKITKVSDTLSTDILRDPFIYSNFAIEAYIDKMEPWYMGRSKEIKEMILARTGDEHAMTRMVRMDICKKIGTNELICLGIRKFDEFIECTFIIDDEWIIMLSCEYDEDACAPNQDDDIGPDWEWAEAHCYVVDIAKHLPDDLNHTGGHKINFRTKNVRYSDGTLANYDIYSDQHGENDLESGRLLLTNILALCERNQYNLFRSKLISRHGCGGCVRMNSIMKFKKDVLIDIERLLWGGMDNWNHFYLPDVKVKLGEWLYVAGCYGLPYKHEEYFDRSGEKLMYGKKLNWKPLNDVMQYGKIDSKLLEDPKNMISMLESLGSYVYYVERKSDIGLKFIVQDRIENIFYKLYLPKSKFYTKKIKWIKHRLTEDWVNKIVIIEDRFKLIINFSRM